MPDMAPVWPWPPTLATILEWADVTDLEEWEQRQRLSPLRPFLVDAEIAILEDAGLIAADLHPRMTGQDHFDRMTPEQQDAAVGPAAAEKLRAGEITLADLVQTVGSGDQPGFLVQKPLQDL